MPGTVLIVDADQSFTESAQSALEAKGCTVHIRDDAPLDLIRKLRPHVMMLNVELPKGASTGFSICSRIRRDRELKATPILLTSSDASVEALKKHAASADHADDYARKPLTVDDVVTRIDRLLQNVQIDESAPKNGDAQAHASEDEFSEEERGTDIRISATPPAGTSAPARGAAPPPPPPSREVTRIPGTPPSPPPQPRAPTTGGPTPPPPPVQGRAPTTGGPPPVPPPLKQREATATAAPAPSSADELWRSIRIEDALRSSLDVSEPPAPAKATPEERLAYMRQLVRYYEAKDKVFRELWSGVQQQGSELARRTQQLGQDLVAREKRTEEVLHDRDNVHRRLVSVETEFKTFQDEITRIFRDKDAEEAQTFGRISELETLSAKLRTDLEEERRKNRDHEHRLQIFQDEVESLTAEKDDAEAKVLEMQSQIEEIEHVRDDTKARLETTETVASERADEIEHLREKYDRLAIDSEQDRQKLERDHAEALANAEQQGNARVAGAEQDAADRITSLEAEHEQEIADLNTAHEKTVSELKTRQAQLLETLSGTHESEVEALETERAEALARIEELDAEVKELKQSLQQNAAEREAEVGALQADVESLESSKDSIAKELESTAEALEATTTERDYLQQQLDTATASLTESTERIESLETKLDDESAAHRVSRERIAELEEELESSQNEGFERLAELEKLKKAHEKLTAKASNFETSLKISEKALGVSEGRVKALEAELASTSSELGSLRTHFPELEEQQDRLEQQLRDTTKLLEEEREKRSGAEDLLLQAKSRIDELEAMELNLRQEHGEDLRQERSARAELELELESARDELGMKEAALAEAYSTASDAERRLKDSGAEKDASMSKLEKELTELRGMADSLTRDVKALEATERALLEEIDRREERVAALEAEKAHLETSKKKLDEELHEERNRSRGFSQTNEQLKTKHHEMMRRIVRSLDAALDLLRRKHHDPELDALQAIAEDVANELPKSEQPPRPIAASAGAPKPRSAAPVPPPPAKRDVPATGPKPPIPSKPVPSKPISSKANQPLPVVSPAAVTAQVKATDPAAEIIAREVANQQLSVHSSDISPIDLLDGIGSSENEAEPPRIKTRVLDAPLQKVLDAKIDTKPPAGPKKPRAQAPVIPAPQPLPPPPPPPPPRTGGTAVPSLKDEPFAALVAELHAAAAEQDAAAERARGGGQLQGFDESFAEESTTTDGPSMRSIDESGDNHRGNTPWNEGSNLKSWGDQTDEGRSREAHDMDSLSDILSQPPPRGRNRRPIDGPEDPDDPDDRNITEIVSLEKIK